MPSTNRANERSEKFAVGLSPKAAAAVWRANRKDSQLYWAAYHAFSENIRLMQIESGVEFMSALVA